MAILSQSNSQPTDLTRALCEVQSLGLMSYSDALALQRQLVLQRTSNAIPDQLVLLQHPHVVTKGRNARDENLLLNEAELREKGVQLHEADRGGDVTYHGPGQLVAYPIVDLRPDRCDLHRYVRDLERVIQATLMDFGVVGHTVPGRTGVWVHRHAQPDAKIAAIGVRVSRWVTSHGIALNVAADLDFFELIVPCGLRHSAVTSLSEVLPETPPMSEVGQRFAQHFGDIFERRMRSRVEGE